MRFILCTIFFLGSHAIKAQIIKVIDQSTKDVLIGAYIKIGVKNYVTNGLGQANLDLNEGQYSLEISFVGYEKLIKTIYIKPSDEIEIALVPVNTILGEMVITGNKYEVASAKSTVSIDVVSSALIKRNNATSVDKVLQRIPGVEIIDGQPNIRGGSGYSYGAGSRVMVLLDDVPILQADAGFPQWNDLPLELTSQIEVLKGASSSLYGSSALNGIINIRTTYATSQPETGFYTYSTLFSATKNQKWWKDADRPSEHGFSLYHKEKIGKTDVVLGAFGKNLHSFNKNTSEDYYRFSGGIKHKPTERFSYGFNFNVNSSKSSKFFFWKSLDSLNIPAKGTISKVDAQRMNIDPNLSYFDKYGNRHKILSRFHFVDNKNSGGRSTNSQLGYVEYQFHREFEKYNVHLTTGLVNIDNSIKAQLYGDTSFSTNNKAAYIQIDKNFGSRLYCNIGARYERNTLHAPEFFNCRKDPFTGQMVCDTIPNGKKIEAKPVFRAGLNYRIAKASYLRASWGQGYRYPTVAEQFVKTTFGGTLISPNVKLKSESGWSSEVAYRQGFQNGAYKAYADVSVFWSKYQNMIEFNFIDLTSTGFKSVNVGGTDIKGVEVIFAGNLEKGNWGLSHLIGYNYIDPRFAAFDTSAKAFSDPQTEGEKNAYNSSSRENILKYRFKHTFKYDIELKYKEISIGSSLNYYSHMEAIDAIFEYFIVPGLKQYRQENNSGMLILNMRANWKISKKLDLSLLLNNVANKTYILRPGLLEAPRNVSLRVSAKF